MTFTDIFEKALKLADINISTRAAKNIVEIHGLVKYHGEELSIKDISKVGTQKPSKEEDPYQPPTPTQAMSSTITIKEIDKDI